MRYSSRKAKITRDWAGHFRGFEVWKPKHILRCHGPLLIGICLDSLSDTEVYEPVFHFHNLASLEETITFSLDGSFMSQIGIPKTVQVKNHDEKINEIVASFKDQYPLLNSKQLSFNDYLNTVTNYLTGKHGPVAPYPPHIYKDIVLVASYLGETEYAKNALKIFYPDLCTRTDFTMGLDESLEKWRDKILQTMDQSKVIATVESEKEKHKLAKLHDYGLILETPILDVRKVVLID